MARALGTTDAVTTCDCCGKSNLKLTVMVELDDGEQVNYGTTCAARNTGKTSKQINTEIRSEAKRIRDAAAAEYKASAEFRALWAAISRRPRELLGRAAFDFIAAESADDDAARARIAAKYGLQPYEVYA